MDGSLPTPKLSVGRQAAPWYRYYAGYADAFVTEMVGQMQRSCDLVLDPWNGAGTTTSVAAAYGMDALGFDINPAAVVIAKARLLQTEVAPSLIPLTRELLATVEPGEPPSDEDLLLRWMTPRATMAVRRLVATINRVLVDGGETLDADGLAAAMSSLAALMYLALFRVVRASLNDFGGTNPTWLRQKVLESEKVDFDLRSLSPSLLRTMKELSKTVQGRGLPPDGNGRAKLAVADSAALPLPDASAGAVITSPPYCTRIDYAVATLPELATLGMTPHGFRSLRNRLIGTPTRDGTFARSDKRWGVTASTFLGRVAEHQSRASQTYYLPFFSQYFDGMWRSLSEIGRVVSSGGPIVLVVQDSYYKEVRADLATVMSEMASNLGWRALNRQEFHVKTKANMNPATRKYRAPGLATETVLAFSK